MLTDRNLELIVEVGDHREEDQDGMQEEAAMATRRVGLADIGRP